MLTSEYSRLTLRSTAPYSDDALLRAAIQVCEEMEGEREYTRNLNRAQAESRAQLDVDRIRQENNERDDVGLVSDTIFCLFVFLD